MTSKMEFKMADKKKLVQDKIDANIRVANICIDLLNEIVFDKANFRLLSEAEKSKCQEIFTFLKNSKKYEEHSYPGFRNQIEIYRKELVLLDAELQVRLAQVIKNLSTMRTDKQSGILKELQDFQEKIVRNRKKMEPVKFTRLLKRVNIALKNKEYKQQNFDHIFDDMKQKYKQGLLDVKFVAKTVDNEGKSEHYRIHERLLLLNDSIGMLDNEATLIKKKFPNRSDINRLDILNQIQQERDAIMNKIDDLELKLKLVLQTKHRNR